MGRDHCARSSRSHRQPRSPPNPVTEGNRLDQEWPTSPPTSPPNIGAPKDASMRKGAHSEPTLRHRSTPREQSSPHDPKKVEPENTTTRQLERVRIQVSSVIAKRVSRTQSRATIPGPGRPAALPAGPEHPGQRERHPHLRRPRPPPQQPGRLPAPHRCDRPLAPLGPRLGAGDRNGEGQEAALIPRVSPSPRVSPRGRGESSTRGQTPGTRFARREEDPQV